MKKITNLCYSLIVLGIAFSYSVAAPPNTSSFIKVDQFGYFPNSSKVAVISDPQVGFNADESFTPSTGENQYQVRRWADDAVVFSGTATVWNNGNTHVQSGDRVWWFDFTSVATPGSYYVFDVGQNVGSFRFEIASDVYNEVLKHAMRTFFYQRVNFPKQAPYADPRWTDAAAFERPGQDRSARPAWDKNNDALARDVSGGWFDAGDYNKYVTFSFSAMMELLEAYRDNPQVFKDNYNIPESGNGIPDILDEVKWELDWLLKMQDPDGSAYIKVGADNYNVKTPPSTDDNPRYYVQKCSSASRTLAAIFALASTVYKSAGTPQMTEYGNLLLQRAELSWNYFTNVYTAFDTECDNQDIKSGDADKSEQDQREIQLAAAVYLFEATNNAQYRTYFDNNYASASMYSGNYWRPYSMPVHEAMLRYTVLPGATAEVANNIRTSRMDPNWAKNDFEIAPFLNQTDAYRAHMPDWAYHWGSNHIKSDAGNANMDIVRYDLEPGNNDLYRTVAENYLHYLHGINPMAKTFLSNMGEYGAENSVFEMYHNWFMDGTQWDNAQTSIGPAPGYVIGGPNKDFAAYCGGCYASTLSPPRNQPVQKSYKEWNTAWNAEVGDNENSWEITEPAIYYQAAYIRLLSRLISPSSFGNTDSTALRDPENPANTVSGLNYSYYHGNWTSLPDFNTLTPAQTGSVDGVDISPRTEDNFFAFRFTGYINIPEDGVYTFYTTSDDGSKLLIGDQEVVDNDGLHLATEQSGSIGLKAGKHAITVLYFDRAGNQVLTASYSSPSMAKMVIPNSAFFRPQPSLRPADNPSDVVNGLSYKYYHGTFTILPDFTILNPAKTGMVTNLDLSPRTTEDNFAFVFNGYVNVPASGTYTFYLASDDGSRLLIGDQVVVNNDGLHSYIEKSGTIGLEAGKHVLTVQYFDKVGAQTLKASYSGPGFYKRVIPASAYFRPAESGGATSRIAGLDVMDLKLDNMIYPNPSAQGEVTLFVDGELDKVTFMDLTGRVKLQITKFENAGAQVINISSLGKGLYIVSVNRKDGRQFRTKLIID